MTQLRILGMTLVFVVLCAAIGMGETKVTLAISGPGAVNDTTIKAGEPVSVDIYWENGDDDRRGFTTGFKITSETIKNITHVADSGNGINDFGDVKAHNGWEGFSAWDFSGIRAVLIDWDGQLPDLILVDYVRRMFTMPTTTRKFSHGLSLYLKPVRYPLTPRSTSRVVSGRLWDQTA